MLVFLRLRLECRTLILLARATRFGICADFLVASLRFLSVLLLAALVIDEFHQLVDVQVVHLLIGEGLFLLFLLPLLLAL